MKERTIGRLDRSRETSGSDPGALDSATSDDTGLMQSAGNKNNPKAVARTTLEAIVNCKA